MVSFGYWNATTESFLGFFGLTVPSTQKGLLNPQKYKKYCSNRCSGKDTQLKYMPRNPLTEKIVLKSNGKDTTMAFIRGIN